VTAPFPPVPLSPEREAIELAKAALELQKLEIDTERAAVDKIKAEAEALSAQHDAALKAIEVARQEQEERDAAASDDAHFTYLFDQPVNEESVGDALEAVDRWHRQHPESDWHLIIDSPGGYVNEGFHLFDQLYGYSIRGGGSHHITGTVRGMAASMAGILLQAVDQRLMGPHAMLHLHQIGGGAFGRLEEIKDEIECMELLEELAIDAYMERARISRKKFKRMWNRKEVWLPAPRALRLGFIDGIG
jgi:ATP-dependent protease ClpP protease subunit